MPNKFCSEAYFFQTWGSLTSLKSLTRDPQLKVPPGGLVLRIFMSWKNPTTSVGFEPANLGSRSSTLPRDHRWPPDLRSAELKGLRRRQHIRKQRSVHVCMYLYIVPRFGQQNLFKRSNNLGRVWTNELGSWGERVARDHQWVYTYHELYNFIL